MKNGRVAAGGPERGAALVIVLVMLVFLGLSLGMAGTTWKSVVQQAREEELFWRGDQIRRAIESYYEVKHGAAPAMLPKNLKELTRDPRFVEVRRHLRREYLDPMTGAEFVPILQGGQLVGVRSTSTEQPFRQDGFPEEYEHFKGAQSYQQWEFIFTPKTRTQPAGEGRGRAAEGRSEAGGAPR